MPLPETQSNGFLPVGVHGALLDEILDRFGKANPRRQGLAARLLEILRLARETGKLRRAFVWGSFISGKKFPGDLDVFLYMAAGFDLEFASLPSPQKALFEHQRARVLFEADVFWATEAIGEKELASWLEVYQISREMISRGIVEVIFHDR